jgi:hypothetical protein
MVQVSTAVGTSGIGDSGIGGSSAETGLDGFDAMFQNIEQQAATNEENLSSFTTTYNDAISRGDGNSAVNAILKAVENGSLDPATAQSMLNEVGPLANENGGGKISDECQAAAKAMGFTINPGESQAAYGFGKFISGVEGVASKLTFGLL